MYTEIWHTCFFYLTKRFYEKILFEPDHIARKLFCNEHVKIKIFISKKEILSIQRRKMKGSDFGIKGFLRYPMPFG